MKQITKQQYSDALGECLRESFEMRLNQHLYVEAIYIMHSKFDFPIIAAVYDMGDTCSDFSVSQEIFDGIRNDRFTSTYLAFDDLAEMKKWIFDLMNIEMADSDV